jgi:hypothetical protein
MMTDHLKNEMAWARQTAEHPPHVSNRVERAHVFREYRRLAQFLADLDNALRGWTPKAGL